MTNRKDLLQESTLKAKKQILSLFSRSGEAIFSEHTFLEGTLYAKEFKQEITIPFSLPPPPPPPPPTLTHTPLPYKTVVENFPDLSFYASAIFNGGCI